MDIRPRRDMTLITELDGRRYRWSHAKKIEVQLDGSIIITSIVPDEHGHDWAFDIMPQRVVAVLVRSKYAQCDACKRFVLERTLRCVCEGCGFRICIRCRVHAENLPDLEGPDVR